MVSDGYPGPTLYPGESMLMGYPGKYWEVMEVFGEDGISICIWVNSNNSGYMYLGKL